MFRKNRQEYSHKIDMYFLCMVFSLFVLLFPSLAQANKAYGVDKKVESARHSEPLGQDVWRLKIQEAAIVRGDKVLLGEIAEPLGSISREKWQELAKKELWDSPPELGKPYKISKANLKNALRSSLGMYADSCLLPNALVLQRGGEVVREEKLRQMAMQYLTPQMNKLGGRSDLTDFRLPAYIFVSSRSQNLVLEKTAVEPGRINLRFAIQEMDGKIIQRFTGTAFLNVWVDTPAAARPLAKGDTLNRQDITFKSVNLAYERAELWDGKGGPWQVTRPLGAMEVIGTADLKPLSTIKKGDKVTLVYQKNGIHLSVLVEAMEDGALGDTVLVRNIDSKKQIYGKVQDNDTLLAK